MTSEWREQEVLDMSRDAPAVCTLQVALVPDCGQNKKCPASNELKAMMGDKSYKKLIDTSIDYMFSFCVFVLLVKLWVDYKCVHQRTTNV